MKLINLYICLFSITFGNLFSQDIITKTDGTEIKAKILEINTNDIKYKKFNYQDGPTITILISDLNNIKYSNGEIESFKSPTKLNKIVENSESKNSSSINKNELIKTYYASGELLSETQFVDGKMNGLQKLYYKNGKIISETPFTNNLANGVSKIYYKNGRWMYEVPYINGNITGTVKYQPFKRMLIRILEEVNFIENKGYYPTGELYEEIPKGNGIINGTIKYYRKTGELLAAYPYINNVANGKVDCYYKNGNINMRANYIDGEDAYDLKNIIGEVNQGLQQGVAYENMMNNTNTQTVNDYAKIAKNNYTKSSDEAIKSNNELLGNSTVAAKTNIGGVGVANTNSTSSNSPLTDAFNKNMIELNKFYNTQHPDKPIDIYANTVNYNNTQNSAESAAATNGGSIGGTNSGANGNTGDSKELAICGKQAEKLFENSQELKNMYANPNCSKMATIASRKRTEIYLNNCRSLLSKADIDGLTQGLAKMQAHINSMPDCQNIIYGK